MDFRFTPEEEAFRKEVLQFIKEEMPPDYGEGGESQFDLEHFEFTKRMARKLGAKKWLAMNWPEEHGGLGVSPIKHMIFKEESAYHRIPGTDMGVGGISWVGPTLLLLGTEEQKKKHLPPLAAGEKWWCTMYSEPEAGSDMAALQCRAVAHGDEYIVNGQKVWTSGGHIADWGWLLVRTDPTVANKHHGISLLLVDMKTPGVTIRPLINLAGHHYFNEIFFDDAHIPKANLIGEENRGWYHTMIALSFERSGGVAMAAGARRSLDDLVEFAKKTTINGKPLAKDPFIRYQLAELAIEIEAIRMVGYRIIWKQTKGEIPGVEAPVVKTLASETIQKMAKVATQMMGLYGQLSLGSKQAFLNGRAADMYLSANNIIVAMGTNEIQRNIIAQRGLGLPRT